MGCGASTMSHGKGRTERQSSFQSDLQVEKFFMHFLSSGNVRDCVCRIMAAPGCKECFLLFMESELTPEKYTSCYNTAMEWAASPPPGSLRIGFKDSVDTEMLPVCDSAHASTPREVSIAGNTVERSTLVTFTLLVRKFVSSVEYKEWRAERSGYITAAMASLISSGDTDLGEAGNITAGTVHNVNALHCRSIDEETQSASVITRMIACMDPQFLQDISFSSQWVIRFLSSVHDMPVPFIVSSINRKEKSENPIVYSNTSFLDTMGLTVKEVQGSSLYSLIFKNERLEIADENYEVFDVATKSLASYIVKQKDANDASFTLTILSKPVFDQDGHPQFVISVIVMGSSADGLTPFVRNIQRYERFLDGVPDRVSTY